MLCGFPSLQSSLLCILMILLLLLFHLRGFSEFSLCFLSFLLLIICRSMCLNLMLCLFNMDGSIEVSVYNQLLSSANGFKYLGVLLPSCEKMCKACFYGQAFDRFSAAYQGLNML